MANQLSTRAPLTDQQGRPLFTCHYCDKPLSVWDVSLLGLREPHAGESAEDYCDAEVLDVREMVHLACLERAP